jgi:hypothetical protein
MAVYTPDSTGLALVNEVWNRTIEPAVYDKMVFIPNIKEHQKLAGLLHIPKLARMSSATLAQSASGAALSATSNTEVEVTVTPVGTYLMVQMSQNQIAQTDLNIDSAFVQNVEDAMAEGLETNALANISSLTTNQLTAAGGVDAATWRSGIGKLRISARSLAEPGSAKIHTVFHPAQYDDILAIPEFTNAEMRGDGENPRVKGVFVKAAGAMLHFSNVVPSAGAGSAYGCIWIESAFGISWNERVSVEHQTFEKSVKIIGYANNGSNVVHDGRAVRITAPST